MANKKTKKKADGNNIRFSGNAYSLIKNFCEGKGYKIGAFSEIAVLEKIEKESTQNL